MIAILLYTAPTWVFFAIGYLLLVTGVCAFFYCASEIDHRIDEQEARIIESFSKGGKPRC
jgi:hypothetical protein